jgi:hypothetical protein
LRPRPWWLARLARDGGARALTWPWPWLASDVGAHARGRPVAAAAWLACACSAVPRLGALVVGGSATASGAFYRWWVMVVGLGAGS